MTGQRTDINHPQSESGADEKGDGGAGKAAEATVSTTTVQQDMMPGHRTDIPGKVDTVAEN